MNQLISPTRVVLNLPFKETPHQVILMIVMLIDPIGDPILMITRLRVILRHLLQTCAMLN